MWVDCETTLFVKLEVFLPINEPFPFNFMRFGNYIISYDGLYFVSYAFSMYSHALLVYLCEMIICEL